MEKYLYLSLQLKPSMATTPSVNSAASRLRTAVRSRNPREVIKAQVDLARAQSEANTNRRRSSGGGSSKQTTTPSETEKSISSPILNRPVTTTEVNQATAALDRTVAEERELVRSGVLLESEASGPTRTSLARDAAVEQQLRSSGVVPGARVPTPEPARGVILGTTEVGRRNIARVGRVLERQSYKQGPVQDIVFTGALGQEPAREQVRAAGQFLSKAETRPVRTITGVGLAGAFPAVTTGVVAATTVGLGVSGFLERGRSTSAFSPRAVSGVREFGVESTQTRIPLPFTEKSLSVPFTEFLPGRRARFESIVGERLRSGGVPESEIPGLTQRLANERRSIAAGETGIAIAAEIAGEARGRGIITGAAALGKAVFTGSQRDIQRQGFVFGAQRLFGPGVSEATIAVAGSQSLRTGSPSSFESLAIGGAVGGVSASLVGGSIIGREVAGTSSRGLRFFSNVADPNEILGDVAVSAGSAARRRAGGVTFDPVIVRGDGVSSINVVARSRPDVTIEPFSFRGGGSGGGSRASRTTRAPVSSFSGVPTSAPSSVSGVPSVVSSSSRSPVVAPVFTPSTRFSSSGVVSSPSRSVVSISSRSTLPGSPVPSSPSNSLSPVFTFTPAVVPTTTRIDTRTFVPSVVPSSVNVVTATPPFPPLPFFPPGGGLGGSGVGLGGRRRSNKGYAPSVAAVAFGITGKAGKKGGFSGLELRPISSRTQSRSFVNRIAG